MPIIVCRRSCFYVFPTIFERKQHILKQQNVKSFELLSCSNNWAAAQTLCIGRTQWINMKSIMYKESLCPAIIEMFHWAYSFFFSSEWIFMCRCADWMACNYATSKSLDEGPWWLKPTSCSPAGCTDWGKTLWPQRVFWFTRITLVLTTLNLHIMLANWWRRWRRFSS